MNTYIVCEGVSDKQILESLLPKDLMDSVVIVDSGSRSSVISLSRSLLVQRQAPVLVFIDADATSPEQVASQQQDIDSIVGGVAISPFKVVLAVPEIETIFFYDIALLSRLTGQTPSPLLLNTAIYQPSQVLNQLMPGTHSKQDHANLLAQLSEGDRDLLRTAPPIQDVIQFLQSVQETANVA